MSAWSGQLLGVAAAVAALGALLALRPLWPFLVGSASLVLTAVPAFAGEPATRLGVVALYSFAIMVVLAFVGFAWPMDHRRAARRSLLAQGLSRTRALASSWAARPRPQWLTRLALRASTLYYAALALLATLPLYAGPYLIMLDMTSGPHVDASRFVASEEPSVGPVFLVSWAMDALGSVIGVPAMLRIVFFLVLFGMGVGMHRFAPAPTTAGKLFAGTLYVVNPFVYTRLIAGQWVMALSLAALPFALLALQRALDGDRRARLPLALWTTLAASQIQFVFVLGTLGAAILIARATAQDRAGAVTLAKRAGVAAAWTAAVSTFWVVPLLLTQVSALAGVSRVDLEYFAPRSGSGFGVLFDLLGLYGFWREGYVLPRASFALWWIAPIVYVALVALALRMRGSREERAMRVGLAVAGGVGLFLAAGRGTPLTASAFTWLWDHAPAVQALRDSQKMLAVLLVTFATLGGLAVSALVAHAGRRSRVAAWSVGVALLAIPIASAAPMLAGYQGQLRAQDYPPEWYQARDAMTEPEAILVLPWHIYMDHSWVELPQARVANPAASFFEQRVLTSDRAEIGEGPSGDPAHRYIESLLHDMQLVTGNPNGIENFGNLLSPLGIRYVVLYQEGDVGSYQFLRTQKDLRVLVENPRIVVFENQVPVGRSYASGEVMRYADIGELVELSKTVPLNSVIATPAMIEELEPTGAGRVGPVPSDAKLGRIGVDAPADAYVVLTLTHAHTASSWRWDGEPTRPLALGFLPTALATAPGAFMLSSFWAIAFPTLLASSTAIAFLLIRDHRHAIVLAASRANTFASRARDSYMQNSSANPSAFIHPTATVEPGAALGDGTKVWHYAQVRRDARLGRGCVVGKSAFIDHGVTLGDGCKVQNFATLFHGLTVNDNVFIGPSATFTNDRVPRAFDPEWKLGRTVVEEGASIGANATINCDLTIGRYAMVASGSVVTKSVPPHALVMGNPARVRAFVCICGARLANELRSDDEIATFGCSKCERETSLPVSYLTQYKEAFR